MSDKFQALDALLQVHPEGLSDDDRTYWAQRWAVLEQAAEGDDEQDTVSIDKVVHVLDLLVRTANSDSLRTDQSVSQLMAKTKLSETTVKRCLRLLRDCELVPVLSNGGGRNKRPAVRWVQFVDDYRKRAQAAVENSQTQAMESRTQAMEPRTQATSGPHYSITTEPLPTQFVAANARATGAPVPKGEGQGNKGQGSWCDQVAWNVAAAVLRHEQEQGRADKVRSPDSVIRSRKLPAAQDWVQELMQRSDAQKLQLLSPTDSDLITWGVSGVLGDGGGVYAGGAAVKRAHALADEQRPAMGAAG
jgi:hypothetical protein